MTEKTILENESLSHYPKKRQHLIMGGQGALRLFLCISVIIFHSSGLLGQIGYSAVFGFYIMSGFAITFVFDNVYDNKLGKFWINRVLKIYPAYFVVTVISMLLYYVFGNDVSINGQDYKLFVAALDDYSLKALANEFLFGYMTPVVDGKKALVLNGFPTITTQAWTNSVEIFFYFTTPFLVRLYKKSKKAYYFLCLFSLIYPCYTLLIGLDFPTYRYRSVFGSYFVFLIGSLLYYNKDKLIVIKHSKIWFYVFILLYLGMFGLDKNKYILSEGKIYFSILLLILIVSLTLQPNFEVNKNNDSICAMYAGGGYLTQKIARAIILLLSSKSVILSKLLGCGTDYFIVPMIALSLIFALLLYIMVDKPLEKVRNAIRNVSA